MSALLAYYPSSHSQLYSNPQSIPEIIASAAALVHGPINKHIPAMPVAQTGGQALAKCALLSRREATVWILCIWGRDMGVGIV
jgi:hypothetical protein